MHKTHRECISFEYSYPQLLVDKWITMVDNFLVLLGERMPTICGLDEFWGEQTRCSRVKWGLDGWRGILRGGFS